MVGGPTAEVGEVDGGGDGPAPLRWLLMASHVPASGAGGGMVRYTVELARALAARDDVELHVLAAPAARDVFVDGLGLAPGRVAGQPWPGILAASLAEVGRLPVGALRRRWDVVQGTKHLLPRRRSGLGLLTVHDMILVDRPGDFDPLKRALLPPFYRRSLRAADLLVSVSRATGDRLVHHLPELADRIRVVPLALAPGLERARPEPVPELVGRPFALVVGDASPRKNLRFVFELWPEVRRQVPDAVLAVAGPRAWARSRGIAPAAGEPPSGSGVELLGHVSDTRLRWAYEACRVVLCPSRQEGFGLPALEAATFGAPLVTSGDRALVETSGPAATHLSLEDGDAWVAAIVERLGAPRPPAASRATVRSWADVADDTVAAVRSAGRRAPGGSGTTPVGAPAVGR